MEGVLSPLLSGVCDPCLTAVQQGADDAGVVNLLLRICQADEGGVHHHYPFFKLSGQ